MPEPYAIDGVAVNGREDWRHVPPTDAGPGPRLEAFPGSSLLYALVSTARGARLQVEGWLQGTSFSQLHERIAAADAMRFDPATHDVSVHGVDYPGCVLLQFTAGPPVAYRDLDGAGVRSRVLYVWQQLTGAGGGA